MKIALIIFAIAVVGYLNALIAIAKASKHHEKIDKTTK